MFFLPCGRHIVYQRVMGRREGSAAARQAATAMYPSPFCGPTPRHGTLGLCASAHECDEYGRKKSMSKSEQYLKEAFAGESQANRTYLAFAQAADKEGHPQVARLFRAAAEAETVHALNHLRATKGVKSTRENLQAAISGETHEFTHMYPEMIEAAKAEGHKEALQSFTYANAVEKVHARLFQNAANTLGGKCETYVYYVCPVCGFTSEKEAPSTCPICGTPGRMFKKMD
jgi:rubrerythrin